MKKEIDAAAEPRMYMKTSLLLICLSGLALEAAAQDAHKRGFYLGAGVGAGRVEAKLNDLRVQPVDTGETIEGDSINTSALTVKITAGYRLADFFAIEASYLNFDDADEKFCFIDNTTGDCTTDRFGGFGVVGSSQWSAEVPITGGALYAVGIWPFNDTLEIFGKVGGMFWEAKAKGFEVILGGIVAPQPPLLPDTFNSPRANKLDGTDVSGGLGINLNTDVGITVKAEAEYFDLKDFDTVWLLSISAFYNF